MALWVGSMLIAAVIASDIAPSLSGASSPANQGVTTTTIRVGIPYLDVSSLLKLGVALDQGNIPDAYNALIADMNAHGGIHGRRIVPYFVPVSPIGTAPATTACTELTEDDRVLVALFPLQPDCYLLGHDTPTINGLSQSAQGLRGAPNFSLWPPAAIYDRRQLSVYKRYGIFAGKRLGLFAGGLTDQGELRAVQTILGSLHVPVVQTAVQDASSGAASASDQQFSVIAQRFHEAGVNEVIAVGSGSFFWPLSLQGIQSSYNPPWVATNAGTLEAAVLRGSLTSAKYLSGVRTSSPTPSNAVFWRTPYVQRCARVVHKAYPTDKITPPTDPQIASDESFLAVENACIGLDLFATIAKAAGENLTTSSFIEAGYRLRNVSVPGMVTPISFGPRRSYVIGPVYLVTYDPTHRSLKYSASSATN
jgi:hypothetical protein